MADEVRARRLDRPTLIVTCASGREGEARRELRGILGECDARSLYMKGNLLVTLLSGTIEDALGVLREARTATIARCIPVSAQASIAGDIAPVETLGAAAALACDLQEGDTFRVVCKRRGTHGFRSRDVEREVGICLERQTPGRFAFEEPEYLVHVEIYQDRAYIGCSPRLAEVTKTITRQRIYAPGLRPLNRAETKLREALEAFGVSVDRGTRAIDLGAAPGGWTKVLAEHGAEVWAVDPAQLDDDVAALPNVTHVRCRAAEFAADAPPGQFDLITNDMNMEPAESAEVTLPLLTLLAPSGCVIMTVKFVTPRWRQHVREARAVLGPHFVEWREKRLSHNARETTVYLRGRA